ncbi:MAG TPA: glycosyltransferase, partial [Thermoanaerobaculia bacterium]|nr:glycosyltransferase [Thermoanaerobaculia bacterium]
MTAKTLLVIGYYGDGNTGDEAVLTSMLRGISAGRQDLRFVVPAYSADPARLRETHGVDSFPFKDIGRMLDAVDEADLVVLGGGGLLHDYWDPRPETAFTSEHFGLSYYCGISWLAALLGKPVMLYGVGVGPLLFPSGRELTRDAAATAAAITVRDTASADLLRQLAGDALPIEVTADPVWQLVPASGDRLAALLEETGLAGRRFLGVAVRNWNVGVDQARWEEQLLAGIEPFAAERGLEILFLPFQHARTGLQNDLDLARGLAARLRRVRGEVLERPIAPEELAGVLGSCEIVAGMRLHSLVFACMTGVPFVALDYDPKVRLHARLLDPPPPVLAIAELQAWSLRQALERVSRDSAAWGERGRALAAEMRRRAGRNDEIARELLDRPPAALPRSLRRPIFDFLRERAEVRAAGTGADDGSAGLRAPAWPPALANPIPLRGVSPGVRVLTPAFFDARGERVFRGGAERYLVELGKVVRGLGHSIEVFQLAQGEPWTREVDGLPVHGLPARDYTLLERAALTATGTRPELTVHLAFYTAGPDTTGPALGVSHGVYWDDPGSQAPSQFRWHREHVLQAVEHLDGMVSVDTNTINWVGATSSRLAGKMVYIPNFVDLEDFRPVPRPEGARTVLLFPRRLVAARGFWLVAEILPRLLARHPEIEFHFVGDAAGAEEAEVRRLVALDPERVRWTSLPPERMPEAYQAADVVLIPTLWSEGTSLSCLEAQASGRAVIATRVGGLPDLVLPGYNGLLIEPNAAALEAAALRLLADPGLRERLAAKGLETVQGFGIERWREHWEDLLRTYLERRDDAMNDRRSHAEAGELGALRARQAELEGTLARLRAEAVEKEIRQRLLLFEQGVEFGDLKAGLESARNERLDQAVAGLSSLEIRHRALEAEKRDLELERAGLRDQREWL